MLRNLLVSFVMMSLTSLGLAQGLGPIGGGGCWETDEVAHVRVAVEWTPQSTQPPVIVPQTVHSYQNLWHPVLNQNLCTQAMYNWINNAPPGRERGWAFLYVDGDPVYWAHTGCVYSDDIPDEDVWDSWETIKANFSLVPTYYDIPILNQDAYETDPNCDMSWLPTWYLPAPYPLNSGNPFNETTSFTNNTVWPMVIQRDVWDPCP